MKIRHKEALKELGVTTRKYTIDYRGKLRWDDEKHDEVYAPEIWGTALIREHGSTLYIEHQANEYGGSWAWYLRTKQGDHSSSLSKFKRQQDALAGAIGYWYTY
jgi:hypothetical protein